MIGNLFSFKGRASRTEFWMVHIVAMSVQLVAIVYLMLKSPALSKFIKNGSVSLDALTVRNLVDSISLNRWTLLTIVLAPLVVLVATAVRRLHDRDKTGWWVLAMLLPIFVSLFLSDFRPDLPRPNSLDLFAIASAAWYFSDLGVLDGSPGANSYAPHRSPAESGLELLEDGPMLDTQRSQRNAEAAMERAIAERRGVGAAGEGVDRRRGLPDTRENKTERRSGQDRRNGGQSGGQGGFGRRAG